MALVSPSLTTVTAHGEYNLAPSSRDIYPASVRTVNGSISSTENLVAGHGYATFLGDSAVTLDFGKNLAGLVSFDVQSISNSTEFIGFTFSESSLWISGEICDATTGTDAPLWFEISEVGSYSAANKFSRGGFRYMSIIHNTTGSVQLGNLSVHFTAMPHIEDDSIRNYTGLFYSVDEKLNRVWYAGAYTNQICTIDPTKGNSIIRLTGDVTVPGTNMTTWFSNDTIANGTSALVDGGKRDRIIWPGDMAIAVPSIFVSTNDLITVRNSLDALFILQKDTGALSYAGYPFSVIDLFSFTYHLYTLIGLYDYYLFTGNETYLAALWNPFKKALNFSLSYIDDSGLMNVTNAYDWGRFGMGGHNIEANSILYYTIGLGLQLADVMGDNSVTSWEQHALNIKEAANIRLWDAAAGLYRDNETATLHPQDGNAWAVISNLTSNNSQIASISENLSSRWTPFGPPAIECADTVSPFISGFELQAHYIAGQPERALNLIRFMWADFMLDDPRMTNSTFIEAYATDGSLHYAAYTDDSRISHAHGWSSGPTSALTFHAAGLGLVSAQGKNWAMTPQPGGLEMVEAGFTTGLGSFAAKFINHSTGWIYTFQTPTGTCGSLSVERPECDGVLSLKNIDIGIEGKKLKVEGCPLSKQGPVKERIVIGRLQGGSWVATLTCF